jgi:hypothetical protein
MTPRFHLRHLSAALLGVSLAASAAGPDWSAVDKVFGVSGKDLAGGVHRFGWPRSDLKVRVGDVAVEPGLALGSWGGFLEVGAEAMVMGDLVLSDTEVTPVVSALLENGLKVTAIHNHLLNEQPHVAYVHFSGHGDREALARGLRAALERTRTPLAAAKAAAPSAEEEAAFKRVQEALGRTGSTTGHVLSVGVPRAEEITEDGMVVPASLGMSISMNFQTVGPRVATTGDFVLLAAEVNPVIRELRAGGIEVTALHSHMLTETPRLFVMHFWGVDVPERIGGALKAALSKVNARK